MIDRMAPGLLSAVVTLLEVMLDSFARGLATAPYDDEPPEFRLLIGVYRVRCYQTDTSIAILSVRPRREPIAEFLDRAIPCLSFSEVS